MSDNILFINDPHAVLTTEPDPISEMNKRDAADIGKWPSGTYSVNWEDAPEITHMKPDKRIFGSRFPIGENKQICIINDCIKYVVRIYIRERENKDAPWSKWELKYIIEN